MQNSRSSGKIALVNGEFVDPELPVFGLEDRGFAYADGAFETFRCIQGRLPLESFHFARLAIACETLRLSIDDSLLSQSVQLILRRARDVGDASGVLKVMITRANLGRGCYLPESNSANITLVFREQTLEFSELKKLVVSNYPLPFSKGLAGLKHMSRLEYIYGQLSLARPLTLNEELMFLDDNQCVVETMHHNIFMWDGQQYLTPTLKDVGVKGVARQALMTALIASDKNIVETDMTVDNLLQAEEVILTNAVQGVVSVGSFSDRQYASVDACLFLRNKLEEQYRFYEG